MDENGVCPVCRAIGKFSNNILNDEFFSVILRETEDALPLPSGYYLVPDSEKSLRQRMERDQYFVRAYGKNKMVTGRQIATKLWVGDYAAKKTLRNLQRRRRGLSGLRFCAPMLIILDMLLWRDLRMRQIITAM